MSQSLPSGFTPVHIPLVAFAVRLGVGAGANALAGLKVMLVGMMLAAGTATANVPVEVGDATDANAKFGARSRLAGAVRAFRMIAPRARLYACPVADPAGTAATAVLTFSGPATAAGVVRLRIAGQLAREVQIPSGTTAAQAATLVAAAVAEMSDLPATGAVGGGGSEHIYTLTASNTGAQGNQNRVVFEVTATGITIALNGASTATSGKAYFGSGAPATAGVGNPTISTALTAISGARYDRIGVDVDDDTLRGTVSTHVDTQSGINVGMRRMASLPALNDTVSTVQADAVAVNNGRVVLLCQKRPHMPGNELLGAYLAAKVYGPQNGALPGEDTYRAAKANGLSLYPAILATDEEERLSSTDVNSLLASGVTVIGADYAHPGYASVVRPVTTRTLNAQGGTSYAVHDTSKVAVPDLVADRLEAWAAANYADKNLVADPATTEEAPSNPRLIWPSAIRDDVLAILREMEEEGLIGNVTANASAVTVGTTTVDGTTYAVASIPTKVVDHLHSTVGDVLQIG